MKAELISAIRNCLDDLRHYASNHGPGPDRRLADLERVLDEVEHSDRLDYDELVRGIQSSPLSQTAAVMIEAVRECCKRPVFVSDEALLKTVRKTVENCRKEHGSS